LNDYYIYTGLLDPVANFSARKALKKDLLQLNPTLQLTGTLPMFVESKSRFSLQSDFKNAGRYRTVYFLKQQRCNHCSVLKDFY